MKKTYKLKNNKNKNKIITKKNIKHTRKNNKKHTVFIGGNNHCHNDYNCGGNTPYCNLNTNICQASLVNNENLYGNNGDECPASKPYKGPNGCQASPVNNENLYGNNGDKCPASKPYPGPNGCQASPVKPKVVALNYEYYQTINGESVNSEDCNENNAKIYNTNNKKCKCRNNYETANNGKCIFKCPTQNEITKEKKCPPCYIWVMNNNPKNGKCEYVL